MRKGNETGVYNGTVRYCASQLTSPSFSSCPTTPYSVQDTAISSTSSLPLLPLPLLRLHGVSYLLQPAHGHQPYCSGSPDTTIACKGPWILLSTVSLSPLISPRLRYCRAIMQCRLLFSAPGDPSPEWANGIEHSQLHGGPDRILNTKWTGSDLITLASFSSNPVFVAPLLLAALCH